MSYQESFSVKEWCTLQFAPLWVFTAVAGADGNIDSKEIAALAKSIQHAPLLRNDLAREVFLGIATNLPRTMQAFHADGRKVDAGLRQVADLLDQRIGPQMANDFKMTLVAVGMQIAMASGPWFRWGTGKVSDEEKLALALVASCLRLSMEQLVNGM
jgi:hypothetical protein